MRIKVLSNFVLGKNHLGRAVFAAKNFKKGDVICKFEGKMVSIDNVPKKLEHELDRYVQVEVDKFMGPSGYIDDYINHSCGPNSGLKFTKAGILLTAIRNIKTGDEIHWDYSTTLFNNEWKMVCDCRTKKCRKIIGDFTLLDPKVQKNYYDLDIVPPYIKNYVDSKDYMVYTKGIQSLKKYDHKRK